MMILFLYGYRSLNPFLRKLAGGVKYFMGNRIRKYLGSTVYAYFAGESCNS